MELIEVQTKEQKKKYLSFRREIFGKDSPFVDNDSYLIRQYFYGKTSFPEKKEVKPVYVEEDGIVLCEAMVIYAKALQEYIQISFFASRDGVFPAVRLLVSYAAKLGRKYGCIRLVAGLNGHVNYGLGYLASHYESRNSFGAAYNPQYYHAYFQDLQFQEIAMNSYRMAEIGNQMERYHPLFRKIDRNYTFRYFRKKDFAHDAAIYTDLNNLCFTNHRYYYKRTYEEDREMLRELFLFMKEESLIFAFHKGKPVAFILWYPDFNELAKPGEAFGIKHFIRNLFLRHRLTTAKVVEYGVMEGHRRIGLPLALIHRIFLAVEGYSVTRAITSWVLEENQDSASFCKALCDGRHKRYVAYEKEL